MTADSGSYVKCCECGEPTPPWEEWIQVVEGGAGLAVGHRGCIEAEWGPAQFYKLCKVCRTPLEHGQCPTCLEPEP
jgi:hypothetical protein